jgi:hypothetical protein
MVVSLWSLLIGPIWSGRHSRARHLLSRSARAKTCFRRGPWLMLSSTASLRPSARTPPRRANLRERILNLFDFFLDQTYPWETLPEEHKILAIQILARLITRTEVHRQQKENNHE